MISILIPTYNSNVTDLVQELHRQCLLLDINFEIIIQDDCSIDHNFLFQNKALAALNNVRYIKNEQNKGRSSNRNIAAKNAIYSNLLFIDAGTHPKDQFFIKNYIEETNFEIVTGGMANKKKSPKKPYKLRWLYTKKRENKASKNSVNICSSNFLITKEIFDKNPFDESLKKYGCEDTVFFDLLMKKKYSIKHINNPVIHNADDDANTFIYKTEQAIENLQMLIEQKKIAPLRYRVSSIYKKIAYFKLTYFVSILFNFTKKILVLNFNSSFPSIYLFDFYRLGYYCNQKLKKND